MSKTAKEMFRQAGWSIVFQHSSMIEYGRNGERNGCEIIFRLDSKYYDSTVEVKGVHVLDVDELKAIHQQMKELGGL